MKTLIIAVSMLVATLALAQTTVTLETNSSGAQNLAVLHCQDNAFLFANACEGGWWQVYAGATYSPSEHVQVALGIGAETEGSRYGGWVWAGEGKFSFIHCFEGSGSGPWHRTRLTYALTPKLTLGVTDRAFYGRGVRAEAKISKSTKLIGEIYEGGKSTLALSTFF